jgi:hypothetical protein
MARRCLIFRRCLERLFMDDDPAPQTPDTEECEVIFKKHRAPDGRYGVSSPFWKNALPLGHSYLAAGYRFQQLERRLQSDDEFRCKYHEFITNYLALGHMQRVADAKADSRATTRRIKQSSPSFVSSSMPPPRRRSARHSTTPNPSVR